MSHEDISAARSDALAGVLMLLIAVVFYIATGSIRDDPHAIGIGPKAFPIALIALIAVLAIALLAQAAVKLKRAGWQPTDWGDVRTNIRFVLPVVALSFAYVQLVVWFQFVLPTFVVTALTLMLFGVRKPVTLVIVSAIVSVTFYTFFFGVLGLSEAPGKFLSYDGLKFFRLLGLI